MAKIFAPGRSALVWVATILVGGGLLYLVAGPQRATLVDEPPPEGWLGRTDPQPLMMDDASRTATASLDSADLYVDESSGGDVAGGNASDALDAYLKLLPQAEAGDSAAQYRLAKLIQSCRFKPRSQLDIENVVRSGENLDQELLDRLAREVDRCGRLAQKIDDLESAANGWLDQAVVGEDPLALAELAVRDLWAVSPVMTGSERARRVQEALRARPREAVHLANQFVANSSQSANVEAGWANTAWWLATCTYMKQCDRAELLAFMRDGYKVYEVDEVLLLESTIDQAVRTGIWTDETFAKLWIVESGEMGP